METPDNKNNVRVYEAETVAASSSGDSMTAENFVHSELAKERKSLRITQIVSALAALFVMAYTGSIASTLNKTLEPTTAANTATGLIQTQVENAAPQISEQIKTQIPKLIEQAPDYAIKELPQYRKQLESRVEDDMKKYFTASSAELSKSFDELLDANKEPIGQMLKDGKDAQATQAVGDAIEQEMLKYVNDTQVNGETLATKLAEADTSLNAVEARMKKLAANKNLTPEEKKARRAIGILTRTIETTKAATPGGKII